MSNCLRIRGSILDRPYLRASLNHCTNNTLASHIQDSDSIILQQILGVGNFIYRFINCTYALSPGPLRRMQFSNSYLPHRLYSASPSTCLQTDVADPIRSRSFSWNRFRHFHTTSSRSGSDPDRVHCKPSPFGKQFCLAYTATFPSYITFQNNQQKIFNPKQM